MNAIVVYLRDDAVADAMPETIEGVPVMTVVTGPIRPL